MHRKTFWDPENTHSYSAGFRSGSHARRRQRLSLITRIVAAVLIPLALSLG